MLVTILTSGMVGAVLSQVISAWVSHSTRKQQAALEVAKLKQAELRDWRETKLKTFGHIMTSMEEISYIFARMIMERNWRERENLFKSYEQTSGAVREYFQQARLFGSNEVNNAIYSAIDAMIGPSERFWLDHDPDEGSTPVEDCTFQKKHHAMFEHINRLREVMRKELGVTPMRFPYESESRDSATA